MALINDRKCPSDGATSTEVRESLAARGLSELEALAYRSNLLASDRAIVNFGGGNTSAKMRETDHAGRETTVLWVKGSGSDLATIDAGRIHRPPARRDPAAGGARAMTDEEMVAYLARCQLDPSMPRPSIETLLHAFVPHAHVDHTHPDAIGAIVGAVDGERLAAECFGSDAVWIPYIRPGLCALEAGRGGGPRASRGDGRPARQARPRHVGRDGRGVVRGDARCDQPGGGVRRRASGRDGGVRRPGRRAVGATLRDELLAAVLPALRGAVSVDGPRILQVDTSRRVRRVRLRRGFAASCRRSAPRAPITSCTRGAGRSGSTSTRASETPTLRERLAQRVAEWRERELEYFERYRDR